MNGLGLAGKLDGLPYFFRHCEKLLNKDGQLILDSSDISYLYEDGLKKPDTILAKYSTNTNTKAKKAIGSTGYM